MENIHRETNPSDSEAPNAEVHVENPQEKGADVPPRIIEGELTDRVEALRQEILTEDANKKDSSLPKPQVAPPPSEAPVGGGGIFFQKIGTFFKKMGKFVRAGFTLFGGLFLFGASKGISGMASLPENISKWTGKGGGGSGHGGASHAKASSHAAPSGGHGSSGHKKGGGGHGHH